VNPFAGAIVWASSFITSRPRSDRDELFSMA
jgi:hypothetical protein